MNWRCAGSRAVLVSGVLVVLAMGCGTVQHDLVLKDDYVPQIGSKVEVELVSNETGTTFDIPVESMFKDALVKALREEGVIGPGETLSLLTNCRIVSYEKGDAFKRRLMPGWGATELDVRCDLLDAGKAVGSMRAKRTVTAGGGYTIGAWEKVFDNVASDMAEDIRDKFAAKKEP